MLVNRGIFSGSRNLPYEYIYVFLINSLISTAFIEKFVDIRNVLFLDLITVISKLHFSHELLRYHIFMLERLTAALKVF